MPTINKVASNISGLAYAEEASIGVLPGSPIWNTLEPNSYADFGGNISTVARSTINASRQRQKGTTTDLDATVGFNHDYLQYGLLRLQQAFFFANAREKSDTQPLNGTVVPLTATTATTYGAAAGLTVKARDLVLASGFAVAANNGLKLITAATATSLTTTGNAVEAAPPASARVQTVGVEFASADVSLTATAANLILNAVAYDLTTLGLSVGEWVFIGGDVIGTRFNANVGYARVLRVSATAITFDQTTFVASTEAGTGKTIRMFFGKVIRNEKNPLLIVNKSVQFERSLGSDGVAAPAQTEYVLGAVANELTLNLPQADKLAVDMSFVGINTEYRNSTVGPKAGARVAPIGEDPFNTSSDLYRTYMTIVDPAVMNSTPLFGYVMEGSINIQNGVTPDKALGKLGAFDVTPSDFTVGGSITAYFTTVQAIAAIRNNADIGFNAIFAKQNSGFIYDIPLMSIGGGRANVEKDKPIMIPLENTAFENDNGYTLLYVNFAYLPTVAMPV